MVELKYNLYICNKKMGFVNTRGFSWSHKTNENQSNMMIANEKGRFLKSVDQEINKDKSYCRDYDDFC